MAEPENNEADPLADLPEDLRARIESHVPPGKVRLTAQIDLDERGSYAEGYLVLAGDELGHFRHEDGPWAPRWQAITKLSEANIPIY